MQRRNAVQSTIPFIIVECDDDVTHENCIFRLLKRLRFICTSKERERACHFMFRFSIVLFVVRRRARERL
jgi:hypothetical protein